MLNNNSFLELFVFLTPCFASDPTKIHSAFSHLVRASSFSLSTARVYLSVYVLAS